MSILLLLSCNKQESAPEVYHQIVTVNLKANEMYAYDTGVGGDEDEVSIVDQASHYAISEIVRDSSTAWIIAYQYQPTFNYTGTDTVVLKSSLRYDGFSTSQIEFTNLVFNISEPSCTFQNVELLPTGELGEFTNPYDVYWTLVAHVSLTECTISDSTNTEWRSNKLAGFFLSKDSSYPAANGSRLFARGMNNDHSGTFTKKTDGQFDLKLESKTDLPNAPSDQQLLAVFQGECQIRRAKSGNLYVINGLNGAEQELLIFKPS